MPNLKRLTPVSEGLQDRAGETVIVVGSGYGAVTLAVTCEHEGGDAAVRHISPDSAEHLIERLQLAIAHARLPKGEHVAHARAEAHAWNASLKGGF